MLTQTTIAAIRTLVHVGLKNDTEPVSIRNIAESLSESPTYMAKVARHLVKAGILKAHRGVTGGVELNLKPEAISLRAIVEACQGVILPNFCQETTSLNGVCAFHVAAVELHTAIVEVLDRWTLEQLIREPGPSGRCRTAPCLIQTGQVAPARKRGRKNLKGRQKKTNTARKAASGG